MLEILLSIVRAVAALPLVLAALLQPAIAQCPPGWYVNGVRPSGSYECRPVVGRPERDISDARERLESGDHRAISGRLRCTGGASPVVIDSRTVGCRIGGLADRLDGSPRRGYNRNRTGRTSAARHVFWSIRFALQRETVSRSSSWAARPTS